MATHTVNCRDWVAFHDHMPPGPFVLRVTGQCDVPQGMSVALQRQADPNPQSMTLVLELVVSGPEVPEETPTLQQEARYEEETDVEYETVAIRLTVPVQDVF